MRNSLAVILFCVFGFSFCESEAFIITKSKKLKDLLERAEEQEQVKNFNTAINIYNEALKIASENSLSKDASFIHKKIGLIYYKRKNYNNSKNHFKKSLSLGLHSRNAADSYFNLCLIYRKEKAKDSLFWALNNSLEIYENLEDNDAKFSTYSKAGILFKQSGQYDTAIKYLLLAYEGFSKTNNSKRKASTSGNIADVQKILGNLDISKVYYREHLALSKQLSDSLKLSFAYNNLGNLFYEEKQYDSAVTYYKEALKIQKVLKNDKNIGKSMSNLGMTYLQLGDLKTSTSFYTDALIFKKQAKDFNAVVQTLNELALISIRIGNTSAAKKHLENSKIFDNPITNATNLLRNYFVWSEYYKSIGNSEKALAYKNLEFNLHKDIFSKEQVKTIQTLQEQFESQLKQQQISDLTFKNDQKSSIISNQEQTLKSKNLLLLLFGLIILVFIGTYFLIKQRQKAKLQALENKKLQAILDGQEEVKSHISKDLHDIITTSYDGVRLKILALTKAKNPLEIQKTIIDDIKKINNEIRLISHRLSPLDDKIKQTPLTDIIISQLSEFQHYRKIFVNVQLPLPEALNLIKLEAQTNFYGIILEILNNVEKHSKANSVDITHSIKDDMLQFTICDNGIGIDQEIISNGVGLKNIKQRTLLLVGDFSITYNEKGTCVQIVFPIKENLKK